MGGKPKCSVPWVGLEPTTHRSRVERTTNWATPVPPEDHITSGPQQGVLLPTGGIVMDFTMGEPFNILQKKFRAGGGGGGGIY